MPNKFIDYTNQGGFAIFTVCFESVKKGFARLVTSESRLSSDIKFCSERCLPASIDASFSLDRAARLEFIWGSSNEFYELFGIFKKGKTASQRDNRRGNFGSDSFDGLNQIVVFFETVRRCDRPQKFGRFRPQEF